MNKDILILTKLKIKTQIGVFAWEKAIQQTLLISLELPLEGKPYGENFIDYDQLTQHINDFASNNKFELIEHFSDQLADYLITNFDIPWIKLYVEKPYAIKNCASVGIQITRERNTTTI